MQCSVLIITIITAPGVELQPVVIPGLPEVAVDAEHLLQLVYGPDVADGEVKDYLHGAATEPVVTDMRMTNPAVSILRVFKLALRFFR